MEIKTWCFQNFVIASINHIVAIPIKLFPIENIANSINTNSKSNAMIWKYTTKFKQN